MRKGEMTVLILCKGAGLVAGECDVCRALVMFDAANLLIRSGVKFGLVSAIPIR